MASFRFAFQLDNRTLVVSVIAWLQHLSQNKPEKEVTRHFVGVTPSFPCHYCRIAVASAFTVRIAEPLLPFSLRSAWIVFTCRVSWAIRACCALICCCCSWISACCSLPAVVSGTLGAIVFPRAG